MVSLRMLSPPIRDYLGHLTIQAMMIMAFKVIMDSMIKVQEVDMEGVSRNSFCLLHSLVSPSLSMEDTIVTMGIGLRRTP